VSRLRALRADAFSALSVPNYRRYLGGQSLSQAGSWMQQTALGWLVLTLTDSSSMLGVIIALQALPVLLLGAYAGVVADRVDKRRVMTALQVAMGVQALVLGVLTLTGAVRVWHLIVLSLFVGLASTFEGPVRQSFMVELVGRNELRNAVSLNSTVMGLARVVGPAVGGILIATFGVSTCFLVNAASYGAVVTSLITLDRTRLEPSPPVARARGQLREGLRYAAGSRDIAVPLVMVALAGTLAYEWPVTLPVLAREALDAGPDGYGLVFGAMGFGAIIGSLVVAARGRLGPGPLAVAAVGLGIAMALATVAPTLPVAMAAMVFVGWTSVAFQSTGNATINLAADPTMRGRVMSLWFIAVQGSTPIGATIVGALMGFAGARAGLGIGAVTCVVVALIGLTAIRRLHAEAAADPEAERAQRPGGSTDSMLLPSRTSS
jgi:MFS family permease